MNENHEVSQTAADAVAILEQRPNKFGNSKMLIGVIALIFTSTVLLIRDMDDPFEGHAKVDIKQIYKLEKYLEGKSPAHK